jgi:hypothetical protein
LCIEKKTIKKDVNPVVNILISSWEQLNPGGGVGATELDAPTVNDGGGRRKSQEFRDLCQKVDVRKEEGVKEDASFKPARILD